MRDDARDTSRMARGLAALEDAVQVLREQLADAQQWAKEERQRADRAEAATTGERTRADVLRSDLDAARQATQSALQAADALRRGRRG